MIEYGRACGYIRINAVGESAISRKLNKLLPLFVEKEMLHGPHMLA